MNLDEIIKIIGPTNSPIAIGGYNSDDFDTDCNIYNLVLFDGKSTSDEIINHESKILKIFLILNSKKLNQIKYYKKEVHQLLKVNFV